MRHIPVPALFNDQMEAPYPFRTDSLPPTKGLETLDNLLAPMDISPRILGAELMTKYKGLRSMIKPNLSSLLLHLINPSELQFPEL